MAELVEQCRNALVWVWNEINRYGGDKDNITISGHSAGGHLVGMMMATDWPRCQHSCPTNLIKGGVSLSGLFDLEPIRLCFLNDTLGLSSQSALENGPIHFNNRSHGEMICFFGNLEGAEYRRQSESIAGKWTRTRAMSLAEHDHFTIVRELDQPDSQISKVIRGQLGLDS